MWDICKNSNIICAKVKSWNFLKKLLSYYMFFPVWPKHKVLSNKFDLIPRSFADIKQSTWSLIWSFWYQPHCQEPHTRFDLLLLGKDMIWVTWWQIKMILVSSNHSCSLQTTVWALTLLLLAVILLKLVFGVWKGFRSLWVQTWCKTFFILPRCHLSAPLIQFEFINIKPVVKPVRPDRFPEKPSCIDFVVEHSYLQSVSRSSDVTDS